MFPHVLCNLVSLANARLFMYWWNQYCGNVTDFVWISCHACFLAEIRSLPANCIMATTKTNNSILNTSFICPPLNTFLLQQANGCLNFAALRITFWWTLAGHGDSESFIMGTSILSVSSKNTIKQLLVVSSCSEEGLSNRQTLHPEKWNCAVHSRGTFILFWVCCFWNTDK